MNRSTTENVRECLLKEYSSASAKRGLTLREERVRINEALFEGVLDYARTRSDVELTFDDANESAFTVTLPALEARRLKARFVLVAGRIGQPA